MAIRVRSGSAGRKNRAATHSPFDVGRSMFDVLLSSNHTPSRRKFLKTRLFTGIALALLLILLLLPAAAKAQNERSAAEDFFEANRAYKNEQFQAAADGYLSLVKKGFTSGQIYYNLGNARFRLGDFGRAILYYERAQLLIPRDDDLNFNLAYAKSRSRDATGDVAASAIDSFLGLGDVNLYEVLLGFVLANGLFFCTLAVRLFKKMEWTYYLAILLAILVVIGLAASALKWYGLKSDDRAVVLADEVQVRAGPDSKDTVLFKVHEGAIVHYERTEDGWALLHLSRDKRGWAEAEELERILKAP